MEQVRVLAVQQAEKSGEEEVSWLICKFACSNDEHAV